MQLYVEALLDGFHAVRAGQAMARPAGGLVTTATRALVAFLAAHFDDSRIVNPDVREMLLQTLGVLLQHRPYVVAFEDEPVASRRLVRPDD